MLTQRKVLHCLQVCIIFLFQPFIFFLGGGDVIKGCKSRNYLIYPLYRGERGSRTYTFKKYHKITNY